MASYVIDSSVLIALLADEPEADGFKRYIDNNIEALVSAATIFEAACVASNNRFADGAVRLQHIVRLIDPEILPFDLGQMTTATEAYARFGRGSGHNAKLNMGDCFSYALAKSRNLPLLFKGNDFIHTDIQSAMPVK